MTAFYGYAEFPAQIGRPIEGLERARDARRLAPLSLQLHPPRSTLTSMLRPSPKLEEIDRRHARERLARRSYAEALEVFSALWREAASLDTTFPGPWRDDIGADLAIARALNGLPPDA